jgi:hypothetical protein
MLPNIIFFRTSCFLSHDKTASSKERVLHQAIRLRGGYLRLY